MSGIEVAGLAIAGVSFFFQAFAGCIQGYELLTDACTLHTSHSTLLIKLKIEQHRLLNWAKLVRLDYHDTHLVLNHMSKALVMGVLEQQQKMLYTFGRLDRNYVKLARPLLVERGEEFGVGVGVEDGGERGLVQGGGGGDGSNGIDASLRFPQTEELLQKALAFSKKFGDAPKRLRWAALDKSKMDGLVSNLAHFNDKMHEALDKAQMESLLEMQTRTNYQIVLLNHSVANLGKIIESQLSSSAVVRGGDAYAYRYDEEDEECESDEDGYEYAHNHQQLAGLAQLKAVNRQLENSASLDDAFASNVHLSSAHAHALRTTQITLSHLHPASFPDDADRSDAVYAGTPAWIEWKYAATPAGPGALDDKTADRVSQLAALLKELHRTVEFRAPRCLGYMRDDANARFGLVFAKPRGVPVGEEPQSLRELLERVDVDGTRNVPPLTRRVALMRRLAETLERLHAVGWLHKGLSSANVLFFAAGAEPDLARPYISGFDYSRPVARDDMTEDPSGNVAEDVYRHPAVQSDGARAGYKKSHDVYALGIVLLEIAHWAPIEEILGIDMDTAGPKVARGVRGRVLGERAPLGFVRMWCGTAVEGVVKACLWGGEGLGLREGEDERDEGVAARLQMGFYEGVVRRLKEVRGL